MADLNYEKILEKINIEVQPLGFYGNLATYIPELAIVNPNKFGIHILTLDEKEYFIGDYNEKFSIQSISKVFSLAMAFQFLGEDLWQRVGVEPSGNPFNSLVQLEYEKGRPRNPFINAGALVIADILVTHLKDPKADFLHFIHRITGIDTIDYNYSVAQSEKKVSFRNAALANMLKSFNNLENDVDEVLDFYITHCAIEMSCQELSKAFYFFANEGMTSDQKHRVLTESQIKRLNALMQTCGFYDESGEFAYKVGLPGKSGVGGGIIAIHPKQYTVSVWGPKLNKKGNSVLGFKALELLTTETKMSIF